MVKKQEESSFLYFAKARYYQAEDGRFLSEDAYRGDTSKEGNWNRYTYVKNNPIRYKDPSGNVYEFAAVAPVAAANPAGAVVVVVLILVGGSYESKKIAEDDLYTKKGQKILNKADQVIINGKTYTKKQYL